MARPIQKVLFIEPRSPQEHIFSLVAIPRLGSLLLGTILEQQGLEVKVVIEEMSTPKYPSLDFHPDLVCISSISSTAPRAYELADFYRQQGLPVVLGGAHPSFLPLEGLEHADYVVCGEGDEALPELVNVLNHGGSLAAIPNLCYRDGDTIHQNPWRPFLGDLDSLPIPNYTLIHGWKARNRRGVVSIATSRGCPFNCSFCSVIMMFGRKHRVTSIDRVIEEIRQNGAQARHIFFCDDNFTADRQRTKELCERIIAEGLKFEWSAQVRVEAAKDPELLELMAKSGCFVVFVGLESINPATLKAYNKSQTVQGIKDCVNNFHHFGIKVHGMFVFGSEEDHYQVIRDTVKVSRQLDLDSVQYLMLTPLPGTPFYKEMEAQNRIICRDWSQYDGHHTVFQPRQFTPFELQMETTRAMRKFYSWTSVIKRLIARDLFFAKMKAYGRYPPVEVHPEKKQLFPAAPGTALCPGAAVAPVAAAERPPAPGGDSRRRLAPLFLGEGSPGFSHQVPGTPGGGGSAGDQPGKGREQLPAHDADGPGRNRPVAGTIGPHPAPGVAGPGGSRPEDQGPAPGVHPGDHGPAARLGIQPGILL